jgi:hypothetical protein
MSGTVNHGIVSFGGKIIASHIWEKAMSRGQFIAVYSSRLKEHSQNHWSEAFVRSLGEPSVLDPEGYGQREGSRSRYGEIARYEPAYDQQFLRIVEDCGSYHGNPTVIVPAVTTDEEALRQWVEMDSRSADLCERLFPYPGDRKKRTERRLRDVIRVLDPAHGWSFFLAFFPSSIAGIVIFICDNSADVEVISQAVTADSHASLIERW